MYKLNIADHILPVSNKARKSSQTAMKKIFLFLFLLSFHFAYAGTGSANDVILFYFVIIGALAFILAVYFLIEFIRKIINKRREKKTAQLSSEMLPPSDEDVPQSKIVL